jgi:hypothetical protein
MMSVGIIKWKLCFRLCHTAVFLPARETNLEGALLQPVMSLEPQAEVEAEEV